MTTAVPAWIDIDAIQSAEERADVAAVTAKVAEILPMLAAVGTEARAVMARTQASAERAADALGEVDRDTSNGVGSLMYEVTGSTPLYLLLREASDLLDPEADTAP